MTVRRTTTHRSDDAVERSIARVITATESLHQARTSTTPLADVRREFANAHAATDAAIAVALDAGAARAPLLRQLRTQRDRLLMASLSTGGMDVPDCAQPASLAADGPATAGLDFARESAVPGHSHGLNLAAALEPSTRAVAGVAGPHLPAARSPHRHPEEPSGSLPFPQRAAPPATTIVYGDFSDVHCYLASLLADKLVGTTAAVEWRAVQHHPRLSFAGLHLDEAAQQCLAAEWLEAVSLVSEQLTVAHRRRAFVPNTQAAVAGYAEANDAGVGDEVRRLLFHAYWVEGDNIGDPEVLRRLLAAPLRRGTSTHRPVARSGYAVTLAHGPVTSRAAQGITTWDEGWRAPGVRHGSELVVLDSASQVFVGPQALLALARAIE